MGGPARRDDRPRRLRPLPATPDLKTTGDRDRLGWIASLQLGLPLVWTEARRRGFGLADVVRWMSARPASLVGLDTKGAIEVGATRIW